MNPNPYESPQLLAEYLLLHYGSPADVLGDFPGPIEAVGFPTRLIRALLATPANPNPEALDLGCAVGGSSFELARHCPTVLGLDFSHTFIRAAHHLRTHGEHPYHKSVEGDLTAPGLALVPAGIDRTRVDFRQGDATHFIAPPFDLVLAANLLCRLPNPRQLLDHLPALVRSGGQLLLTTPFSWLEAFTPRTHWLGGTPETGRSFDLLHQILAPHFTLEHRADLPFLIREHARKFQYGIACGTRWRRH